MTTAYVVQLNLPSGIQYLTTSGKLSSVPKFFRSGPSVKSYLSVSRSYGYSMYSRPAHEAVTQVIIISDLDKGLKDSKANILTAAEFMKWDFSAKAPVENPRAFYKLQNKDGTIHGISVYRSTNKFGKVWNSSSALRRYLTSGYRGVLAYEGATVIETIMKPDNINIEAVNTYPVLEFYLRSKSSRAHYEKDRKLQPSAYGAPVQAAPVQPAPMSVPFPDASALNGSSPWPGFTARV